MSRACVQSKELIDKRAAGLDDAERLILEAHLSDCASCREHAALMRTLRGLFEELDAAPLSSRARERAIQGAFLAAASAPQPRPRARLLWPSAVALAAAAVLGVFAPRLFEAGEWHAQREAPVAAAPQDKASEPSQAAPASNEQLHPQALASAQADTKGQAHEASAAPEGEPVWLEVDTAQTQRFAHAQVELEQGTRVRFDAPRRALELGAGRVRVDVDASQGQSFEVKTQHFRVVVLGTLFTVEPDSVAVERGRVQVFSLSGEVLAREVGPGGVFSFSRASAAHPEKRLNPRVLLSRARDALSRGDTQAARELVAKAEDAEPSRLERAEATTLRAECALLERNPKAAVQHYLSVAERFSDLTAGENAAFAAAQIARRAYGEARAIELYRRYLKRYPRGRFAEEARAQLGGGR